MLSRYQGDTVGRPLTNALYEKKAALAAEAARTLRVEYPADTGLLSHIGLNQLAMTCEKKRIYFEVTRLAN